MIFGDKLLQLRREKGFSQEQLADLLNVSRQSVSKWEAGASIPELEKIVTISDLFGVSVDYLVRNNTVEREQVRTVVTVADNAAVMEQLGEIRQYMKKRDGYEYKSPAQLLGLPLVHIKFSGDFNRPAVAKGILAIGNIAIGLVSLGGIAVGLLALGGVSLGLLLAFGGLAIGGIAWGGVGIGVIAIGGVAVGVYALGGVAVAQELAVGGVAAARVAVGSYASAEQVMLTAAATRGQIQDFILQHSPGVGEFLAGLFSAVGK